MVAALFHKPAFRILLDSDGDVETGVRLGVGTHDRLRNIQRHVMLLREESEGVRWSISRRPLLWFSV